MSVTLHAGLPSLPGVPSIQDWADYAWKTYREHAEVCEVCGIAYGVGVNGAPATAYFEHCEAGLSMVEHAKALDLIAEGRRVRG